jgi:hypothetical protein
MLLEAGVICAPLAKMRVEGWRMDIMFTKGSIYYKEITIENDH